MFVFSLFFCQKGKDTIPFFCFLFFLLGTKKEVNQKVMQHEKLFLKQ